MVVPLKEKKIIKVTKAFQEMLHGSGHKPIKIWVDKWSEFYNRSVKWWLQDKDIEMHSMKSVVAEIFIRTLKNKIYKYMPSMLCILINYLTLLINTTVHNHSTIKMSPVDVKPSTYIDFNKENN